MPEPELDSVLIAAQLARFCPTSLSFDNLNISCFKESKKKTKYEKNNEHNNIEYIPPKPIQRNNNNNTEKNNISNNKSKFSFLLKSKKQENTHTALSKFVYELPNIKKVSTPIKSNKSLMVISLSVGDLKSIDTPIIKGANQVNSMNDYSSDSEDYYSESD
ncbi:hypothetical protein TVAGG3_0154700 [Trichomonas vaginalis G3]|uniref:hypothetical protein n=1 Tax=Trichomonas vaginalis (strain ATCC PRA-98 / G3) TaxID=412133 RepID=UPI0021E5862F|nr:hypothetical protein TVAGG3_0154700 [Trichomonas vaginalis G3]KAI5547489.1 hypothetical protein TVAGG3_0154700 [Trichomonas vaginalis G3]